MNLSSDRFITLENLKLLNEQSISHGFRYNLDFDTYLEHLRAAMEAEDELQWRELDTEVILVPLMWHDYPQGGAIRCQVFSDDLVPGLLKLDVPIATFYQLPPTIAL